MKAGVQQAVKIEDLSIFFISFIATDTVGTITVKNPLAVIINDLLSIISAPRGKIRI